MRWSRKYLHGPSWAENPMLPVLFITVGFWLLYLVIKTEKHHRTHQESEHGNIELELLGRKVLDTNRGWIFLTLSMSLFAIAAHSQAENTFHVYDTTPIDRFTHWLSGMAVTAIALNLYLTRKREKYYLIAITVS